MDKFLSCDWGTSSFRLRLVEVGTFNVLAEEITNQGIASCHALWQQSGEPDPEKRIQFYLNLVKVHRQNLEKSTSLNLKGTPLIISGMASSSIGLQSLPYGPLPFHADGRGVPTVFFESAYIDHPILLISGIQSEEDVMRGEETQLIGVMNGMEEKKGEMVFIFPGTHSKHIAVKDQQMTGFKTYMTGEFFNLLSKNSILSSSVEENRDIDKKRHLESFKTGVKDALHKNLLNAAFRVRTNELFGRMTKGENFDYLSGLLIGSELMELFKWGSSKIYLCCSSHLKFRYEAALAAMGIMDVHVFSGQWIEDAVIRGQYEIYNQMQKP